MIKSINEKIAYYRVNWILTIQSILMSSFLFILYFLGIGLTKIFMPIFGNKFLKSYKVNKNQTTYWSDPKEVKSSDIESFNRQV